MALVASSFQINQEVMRGERREVMRGERREVMRGDDSAAVVILNWNGEEHLRNFMPSVVEHTPAYVDIIVADNGSVDGSCFYVEQRFAERVQLLRLDSNYGFAGGYNLALAQLNHRYFILLNSDVEVTEGWCDALLNELELDDSVAAVAPKILSYTDRTCFEYAGAAGGFIDILGYPFCRGRLLSNIESDLGQYDDARDIFWASGAAFCCRGDVFNELGGFDEDFFAHMEEIDLCWRMQLAGYRVRVVPRSVLYHLGGGTLISGSPLKTKLNHRNNLAMLYKCAPTWQRILVALLRPFTDILAAISYLLKGDGRSAIAVGEAWWEFLLWHKSLSQKRESIRGSRRSESTQIYRGSILLATLRGVKRFTQL